MNNQDQAIFAKLLYDHEIAVELTSSYMAVDYFDVYQYDFAIYVPNIQKKLIGGVSFEEYDGIHYLDEQEFVGIGYTLKEAWDDFCGKVDVFDFEREVKKALEKI